LQTPATACRFDQKNRFSNSRDDPSTHRPSLVTHHFF
jgi:hypothetical protein